MKSIELSTPIIRGFIGNVSLFKQERKISYRAFLYSENGVRVALPSKSIQIKNDDILHAANLYALKQIIKSLLDATKDRVILYFYTTDDTVAFEYNNEYLKEGHFHRQSKGLKEWNMIIKLINDSNIELHIKESKSCLTGLNKIKGDNL